MYNTTHDSMRKPPSRDEALIAGAALLEHARRLAEEALPQCGPSHDAPNYLLRARVQDSLLWLDDLQLPDHFDDNAGKDGQGRGHSGDPSSLREGFELLGDGVRSRPRRRYGARPS